MTRFFPRLVSVTALLAISACGAPPAPDQYVLRNAASAPFTQCKARGILLVDRPTASEQYDTKRIAVLLDTTQLTYYTGANWASPLPEQLRDFMVDYFARTGQFRLVTSEGEDAQQTLTLSLLLQEADVVNPDAPVVHLRMTAILRRAGSSQAIKTVMVEEAITPTQNHTPEIIAAFATAATHAAEKIGMAMPQNCK